MRRARQIAPHGYTLAAAGALLIAAWLCLVNLDYAALWHDEAPAAVFGKALLQQGDIVGWDGRNLVGGTNGRTLNAELRDVLPPLMYVLNAAGFAVFGVNEVGARIVHALVGIAALGGFYLLLRQHLPSHPRLVFFIFTFAAGSAQLLLYFRQSRYFSVMVLTLILAFYLYERYWRSRHRGYLVAFTLVAAAAFFNHYAGGAATMLSLATWHLLFRARETTWREWRRFAAGGAFVTAAGAGYLAWLGILGGGFLDFAGQTPGSRDVSAFGHFFWKLGAYMRELFTADWISWPVFLWFAGATLLVRAGARGKAKAPARPSGRRERHARSARRQDRRQPRPPGASAIARTFGDDFPLAATGKVILMGALFALFSAVMSPQRMWANPVADLRYYVGALPLLLAMKGLFVEWLWRRHAIAGAAAFALLLLTSAGAAPFNLRNVLTGQDTLGTHLVQFVREVHRPYRDSISVVSDYLLRNAERDDLVYVPGFADREALTFYAGHTTCGSAVSWTATHRSRRRRWRRCRPRSTSRRTRPTGSSASTDWPGNAGAVRRPLRGRRQTGRLPLPDAAPGAERPRLHAARCRQPRRIRPAAPGRRALRSTENMSPIRRGRGSSIRGDTHGQDERENRKARRGSKPRRHSRPSVALREPRDRGWARLRSALNAAPGVLLHPQTPEQPVWKFLWPVLAVAFAVRAAIALSGDFMLHPDEIMQYLERRTMQSSATASSTGRSSTACVRGWCPVWPPG